MGYDVEIGQVLDRRFEITGLLSEGGMATIFRAVDLATGDEVAVKVPLIPLVAFGLLYLFGHRH